MAAATFSYTACTKLSALLCPPAKKPRSRTQKLIISVSNSEQPTTQEEKEQPEKEKRSEPQSQSHSQPLRPVEPQLNVQSKNMSREYGGQWLSSVTRHVRIYAAYIDPETSEFDQTQMDKLTLILDPTDEFVWSDESCNKVYSYFQELVDHYEGAPLTEYTLRLIGSDIEHYIRKMLFNGEIQYNMDAKVLNFSMGKPRIQFNNNNSKNDSNSENDSNSSESQLQDAQRS